MAMTVTNKFTSINFLNLLNRTGNRLDTSLTKISSGQKINSVADNASDYAISERMRGQLRSLNQTDQNVQNGSSMIKVAEGGVQRIVDILRDMKSLAINAANDSNTNVDRQIIQSELTKRLATINDIAIGTKYNQRCVIDGTFEPGTVLEDQVVNVRKFNLQSINMTSTKNYTKQVSPDGPRVIIGENKIKELAHEFTQTNDAITKIESGYGLTAYTKPPMKADFGFNGYSSTWNWSTAYENAGVKDLSKKFISGNEIGVEVKFSGTNITDFDGQGFSILCGGCSQYINITFDMNMSIGQGTLTTLAENVISVKTSEDAQLAIAILDKALEYATDNATKLGSYLQRMDSMGNTIYAMEENTEASKSVIRDTDMSREIVTYTKSNVLSQAAQLMLAQFNRNSFMVLNLLR